MGDNFERAIESSYNGQVLRQPSANENLHLYRLLNRTPLRELHLYKFMDL